MTILTLVRHGQASFGGANYDRLSALGHQQSRLLGEHWRRLGIEFDALYSGELARQRDTATRLIEGLGREGGQRLHAGFNEYDFIGILRGYLPLLARESPELTLPSARLFKEPELFQSAFERCVDCWISERTPEGSPLESWKDFGRRVLEGLREIATPQHRHVVVVTSGGVIGVALREALKLSDAMAFQLNWRIYNASAHSFRVGKRGLSLTGFNNISHLELAGDPQLITFR